MPVDAPEAKQHVHELVEQLGPGQIAAVLQLLEVMLDPVSRALASAPAEDEEISEQEEDAVAEAREWFHHNKGIPFEQVVANLGFTMEEVASYRDIS